MLLFLKAINLSLKI